VVGKTNVGKSTFFSAATLVDVPISNRIFTTIDPNKGVSFVRTECACKKLNTKCNPKAGKCVDGTRYIPVKLVDVAGLVPGAHEGHGLGNQFLSDIMEADALIHVVDISGSTDEQGNPVQPGQRDPKADIKFLEEEIDYWILGILKRNLHSLTKKMEATKASFTDVVHQQLSGLKIKHADVEKAIKDTGVAAGSDDFALLEFIRLLREASKPMVIAGNKIDIAGAGETFERVRDVTGKDVTPCSADSELALRKAAEHGIVRYNPGDKGFKIIKEIDQQRTKALEFIRSHVLESYGSTGVQKCIDHAVFDLLGMIIVYPVENEHKFTDKKGNILPDALLMKKGSTALDLAFAVHQDIGNKFIGAIDARSGRHVSADYELKNGDVISIRAGR